MAFTKLNGPINYDGRITTINELAEEGKIEFHVSKSFYAPRAKSGRVVAYFADIRGTLFGWRIGEYAYKSAIKRFPVQSEPAPVIPDGPSEALVKEFQTACQVALDTWPFDLSDEDGDGCVMRGLWSLAGDAKVAAKHVDTIYKYQRVNDELVGELGAKLLEDSDDR